jgi:hypothetical protein
MKWEDDGYSRRDADGKPVSLVSSIFLFFSFSLFFSFGVYSDSLEQEEYKERPIAKKHRMNLNKGDLKLFAITGYEVFTSYDKMELIP